MVFYEIISPGSHGGERTRDIQVDFTETAKTYILAADLPGIPRDRIRVTWDNGVLNIAVDQPTTDSKEDGEQGKEKDKDKEKEKDEKKDIVHRKERSQNYKPRSIRLPPAADLDKAKAEYVDGVLIIIIPRDEEKARQRKVDVQ